MSESGPVPAREIPFLPIRSDVLSDHEFLAEAARLGPVLRDRHGILITFTYASLERLLDPALTRQMELETMAVAGLHDGPIYRFFASSLLFSNGDRHKARRAPLARAFARPVMEALRPKVRQLAENLVAPLSGHKDTDFLAEIANPLPARIVADVLGAPEADVPHFTRLVYSAIRALSLRSVAVLDEAAQDLAELDAYVEGLLLERRARPREDFLTEYLARIEDADLTDEEVRTQIVSVVLAGADTTRLALASTMSQLLQHPHQWAMLRDDPDALKAPAAAEGLRFDPVIGSLIRVAIRAFEHDGVPIPEGALIGPSVLSALRDPTVYAEPERFDITRTDHPRWHPVFGGGAHRCLGETLARVELEETLAALASLSSDPALAGPPPVLRGLGAVRSIDAMRVSL